MILLKTNLHDISFSKNNIKNLPMSWNILDSAVLSKEILFIPFSPLINKYVNAYMAMSNI